jgi:hypothetical protein
MPGAKAYRLAELFGEACNRLHEAEVEAEQREARANVKRTS